jgi:hypothetical protein
LGVCPFLFPGGAFGAGVLELALFAIGYTLQPSRTAKPLQLIYRNVSNYLTCLVFVAHPSSPVDLNRLLGLGSQTRRVPETSPCGVCSGLVKNALFSKQEDISRN